MSSFKEINNESKIESEIAFLINNFHFEPKQYSCMYFTCPSLILQWIYFFTIFFNGLEIYILFLWL